MKADSVLDASALLSALFVETGHEQVAAALGRSVISAVNYTEVLSRQIREGASPEMAADLLEGLGLPVVPWDLETATAAADLSSLAWTHGLSLGDRACLATGRQLGLTVLTADRLWAELPDVGVRIVVIR